MSVRSKASDTYHKFFLRTTQGKDDRIQEEDWQLLTDELNQVYPDFTVRLSRKYALSETDLRLSLLLKAGILLQQIAVILFRSKQWVTFRHRNLAQQFLQQEDCRPEQWDLFISKF